MGTNVASAWQKALKLLQECSTQQPGSTEAALSDVKQLLDKLEKLPPAPKAVWKKQVQQLKVPLLLGAAFTAAAQHSWKSPATASAMRALQILDSTAQHAGIIHEGANGTQANSLCSSIRQQLEQSGMREQLAAVMIALAADLQSEAAAFASESRDVAADYDPGRFHDAVDLQPWFMTVARVHPLVLDLWELQTRFPLSADWLCNPSCGYAVATLKLSTAALKHISTLSQHVMSLQQEGRAQKAEEWLQYLQTNTHIARSLCIPIFWGMTKAQQELEQQGQDGSGGVLQQLQLSPHMLPSMAAVLGLCATHASMAVAAASAQVPESSSSIHSNGSNSRKETEGSSSTQQGKQQRQGAPKGDNSSSDTLEARQLQLQKLLGHEPFIGTSGGVTKPPLRMVLQELGVVAQACSDCCAERVRQFKICGRGQQQVKAHEQQQQEQQWEFDKQLLLLLPTMLLPCASSLLSPSAQDALRQDPPPQNPRRPVPNTQGLLSQQQEDEEEKVLGAVQQLIELSSRVVLLLSQHPGQDLNPGSMSGLQSGAWVQQLLGAMMQLADQLLYQQQPSAAADTATATHGQPPSSAETAAIATQSSAAPLASSSGSSSCTALSKYRLACVEQLLALLLAFLKYSHASTEAMLKDSSSSSKSSSSSSSVCAVTAAVTPAAAVAARFVKFAATIEAALRSLTVAVQCGLGKASQMSNKMSTLCADVLLSRHSDTHSVLVRHMGLCGLAALAKEQQQLYSLLSTVLKVGCGDTAGARPCLGEPGVGSCCLAAGQAAVGLLKMTEPVRFAEAAAADKQHVPAATAAAAAAQQHATYYLPSLVIFGRCCLQWAEQLQQQAPELLLLRSGVLKQQEQQQREAELHEHSAALVCVPGLRSGAATRPGDMLESLTGTVSEWVGGIKAPATLAQLAAASCAPQQLQQRLQALLLAVQGTQQAVTEASLAALVQQLQKTGAMLCNIAVPHFCNNPACVNISGLTEVRLVSGRSCICAGCHTARYCGQDCQRAAWKQHKPVCKALAVVAPPQQERGSGGIAHG